MGGGEQARQEEGGLGGKLPWARNVLYAPQSLKNIKCTIMHYLKNPKFSPQRGPARMFPQVGPAVALDRLGEEGTIFNPKFLFVLKVYQKIYFSSKNLSLKSPLR